MSKRLVLNMISLLLTSFLLILTVMAWYSTNQKVSANGISGKVQDFESVIEEINVYYATKVNDTTYTKGAKVGNNDQMIYDQFSEVYDPNEHGGVTYKYPARLLELVIKNDKQVNQLVMTTSTSYFPGTNNTVNPGYITSSNNVPISPFLKFNIATVSNTTITLNSFTNYEFNSSTGAIVNSELQLVTNATGKINILFDFDDDKFNLLYSNNIGNSVVDDNNQINHSLDFKLLVFGGNAQ